MFLFSKRSAAVIDGSEKRNGWLNFELQSPYVIENLSSEVAREFIVCVLVNVAIMSDPATFTKP